MIAAKINFPLPLFLFVLIRVLGLVDARSETTQPSVQKDDLGSGLLVASWKGNLDQVTSLVNEGAPIEVRDKLGRTPLFLACHGDPDVVRFLLAHGARVDAFANNGDSTIGRACEYGDLASAQMVLDAGADPSKPNQYGHTPLMLAALNGHDDLVSLLIDQHVDVNFSDHSDPALFFAIGNGNLTTAEQLIYAGADLNPIPPENADPQRAKYALFSLAAGQGNIELIDLFLSSGIDINIAGKDGITPLMGAVQGKSEPVISYLLDKRADPNRRDEKGETALMLAINYQQPPVLQNLLDHGAKLEMKDKTGRTALIWACYYTYDPNIRFLIDHGADINATDSQGETPLTYAGDRGDMEMVQLLREKGAKITDLHIIARKMPEPPLPPDHAWALAVGAIYPQTNGINPNFLGYEDPESVEKIQSSLKDDWDVTDRKTFLNVIEDLLDKGQRASFLDIGPKLAVLSDKNILARFGMEPAKTLVVMKAAQSSYLRWKQRTGLAWDLCRCANLINRGYNAHYINEKEAWGLLMRTARVAQSSFSSWRQMSDNFLDGRHIWGAETQTEFNSISQLLLDPQNARSHVSHLLWRGNETEMKFQACSQLLLNPTDPNSPWNRLPWTTDLGSSDN